jgi:vancomycin resistance protein VanK
MTCAASPPPSTQTTPHVGLIQFKVGTGGQAVRYVGEWDLPLRPMVCRAFDLYMRGRGYMRRRGR